MSLCTRGHRATRSRRSPAGSASGRRTSTPPQDQSAAAQQGGAGQYPADRYPEQPQYAVNQPVGYPGLIYPQQAGGTADRTRLPMLGAAALAAVLAFVAPFLTFTRAKVGILPGHEIEASVTGWGSVHVKGFDESVPIHSARFGTLIVVAVLVLLAGIVLAFARHSRLGDLLCALGSAALVTCGGFGLLIQSTVSSLGFAGARTSVGAGVWLLVAAGVVSLVVLGLAIPRILTPGPART